MGIFDFLKKDKENTGTNEQIAPIVPKQDLTRIQFRERYLSSLDSYRNWGNLGLTDFLYGNTLNKKYPSLAYRSHYYLQCKSRKVYYDSPIAKALIKRLVENTINRGMTLEASPIFDLLGKNNQNEENKKQWKRKVEALWKLWSKSKSADIRELINFNQLQSLAFFNELKDGEYFILLKYSVSKELLNPLQFQILDPLQITDPTDKKDISKGNRVIDGIELDRNGKEIAYYVRDSVTNKIMRIPKYGPKSKRLFIIHGFKQEYPGQVRGIPILTGVINELQKLTDYSIAEIQAAVINASIAGWVEPSENVRASHPLAGVMVRDSERESNEEEIIEKAPADGLLTKPGLYIQNLKAGEKIHSYDTKRPNINFEQFVTSVKKSISASTSIPLEILDMIFGQNYSASRASLVLFWNVINNWRFEAESDLLNPVFKMWLQNEVELERIKADSFLESSVAREAWLNARWVGISKPSIDPFREAKAVNQRLLDGLSTREIEAQQYNGTSYEENIEILKNENDQLAKASQQLAILK